METNRIDFLNTYIDSLTAEEAKMIVDKYISQRENKYIVTPNSDIIVKMQKDEELKHICDNADLILADGEMLVKMSYGMDKRIKERVCMTDFIWDICDLSVKKNYKLFFLGGKKETLLKAIKNVKNKYSNIDIVDAYSPELGFEKDCKKLKYVNDRINKSGADILIVFLGCPKQEKFIYNNKHIYQVPISIPMGGCVDFLAGNVKRAPRWMQKAGLEWFFRFIQEPRRLFKRYFIDDVQIFKLFCKYRKR